MVLKIISYRFENCILGTTIPTVVPWAFQIVAFAGEVWFRFTQEMSILLR